MINGGYFVCEPSVFDYIKDGDKTIWEKDPLETLANDGELNLNYHDGFWKPMDSLKDNKGRVSLYDILKALCDGWNNTTGNYNQLEPTIEEETNTVKITDQVPLPDKETFLKRKNNNFK